MMTLLLLMRIHFLDSRGDMMLRGPTAKRTLIAEVELAAVEAKGGEKVELDGAIDAVIALSHIETCSDSVRPDRQISEERIRFKADPICAQVADLSCVLNPEVLCDILDEKLALSKFSAAIGSTVANPKYPDCAIFYAIE